MNNIIKLNLKWYVMILLALSVIGLNVYDHYIKEDVVLTRKTDHLQYNLYYDIKINNINNLLGIKPYSLPLDKAVLLLGLNRECEARISILEKELKSLEHEQHDVSIVFISRNCTLNSKSARAIHYLSVDFDKMFNIRDDDNFVILIHSDRKIKFYFRDIIPFFYLKKLLRRY